VSNVTGDAAGAGFRVIDATTLCEAGFLTLARLRVAGPDNAEYDRHVVHHPGAVVVVPVDGDEVVMVRQYRVAVGRALLEVVAGKRDVDGETPIETAARELEEEIGFRAGQLIPVCEFYNSPGFTDEYTYLFVATDLQPVERAAASAEEHAMTIERFPLSLVPNLIATRAVVDAKSIIGLTLARQLLGSGAS
jgi:ADP-ribose pyrophosphatase